MTRDKILNAINYPLGFFVLALLIVESSLAIVLIWSNLDSLQKFYGMWSQVGLFLSLMIIVAFLVWHKPKNLIFAAEDHLKEKETDYVIKPPKKEEIKVSSKKSKKFALIEYKVDSVLPGTIYFDLIKDGKVWFWLANLGEEKYKVYINVELKLNSYSEKLKDNYYGGKKAWNLNAFMGIHAPGMPISQKVMDLIEKGEALGVKINCKVCDEKDVIIEERLPITYRYNFQDKSWYLEP